MKKKPFSVLLVLLATSWLAAAQSDSKWVYEAPIKSLDKNGLVTDAGRLSFDASKKVGEVNRALQQYREDWSHFEAYTDLIQDIESLGEKTWDLTATIPLYEFALKSPQINSSFEGQAIQGTMAAHFELLVEEANGRLDHIRIYRDNHTGSGWQEYRIHLDHYENLVRRLKSLVMEYMAERFPD